MNTPASDWRESIPLGNGRIGALVFGNVQNEEILFNDSKLWFTGENQNLPDISPYLGSLRRLMENGEYGKANDFYPGLLKDKGYNPSFSTYIPAFSMRVDIPLESPFIGHYERRLHMDRGEAAVLLEDGGRITERNMFVSRIHDAAIYRIHGKNLRGMEVTVRLRPADREPDLEDKLKALGKADCPVCSHDFGFENITGDGFIVLKGRNNDGMYFGGVLAVLRTDSGSVEVKDGLTVKVEESSLFAVKPFITPEEDGYKKVIESLYAITGSYYELMAEHMADHAGMFFRVQLDLGGGSEESSAEELLARAYSGDSDPVLFRKMFDFGRYLLISSSRKGGLPSHLQGIWNGDYVPPWDCIYMVNENLQMNYWQALPGSMPELLFPLFEYLENRMDDFRENARLLYGCRGILIPADTTPESGILKDTQPHILYWTAGAAWIAQFFYDYYLYTMDESFLAERALPFMKEAADFYEDFLVEDDSGYYLIYPSVSPENSPEKFNSAHVMNAEVSISFNAVMDIAVCRELFGNLIEGSGITGKFSGKVEKWKGILEKLRPYELNGDGAVKEWLHEDFPDNYYHRHVSHLYPVFPGREVIAGHPLFGGFETALRKRIEYGFKEQTGWSLAHIANAFARMERGGTAYECLKVLLRTCVLPNFFTTAADWRNQGICEVHEHGYGRRIFQIDANMGFTSAVFEMLLFSSSGVISILPGLPSAFKKGSVQGLSARGGVSVDIRWNGNSIGVSLVCSSDITVDLRYPGEIDTMKYTGDSVFDFQSVEGRLLIRCRFDQGIQYDFTVNLKA